MELSTVLLFALGSIGLSHIIVDGKILKPFRELMQKVLPESMFEVFTCYQCSGFWCGLFCGYFLISRDLICMEEPWWVVLAVTVITGCAGSFLSTFAAVYLNLLEAKWFGESARNSGEEGKDG